MANKYIKKQKPLGAQEKLYLLSKYTWDATDIQLFWDLRRGNALKMRNFIIKTEGAALYSKTKVLVSAVMEQMNTTVDEQAKLLKSLILESSLPKNPKYIEKDGHLYIQVNK